MSRMHSNVWCEADLSTTLTSHDYRWDLSTKG